MAVKNVWRGVVNSIKMTTQFWMISFTFLVTVCAAIAIVFVLTISFELSAVWDKLKTRLDRKNKNG
jgi:hypothetical protein